MKRGRPKKIHKKHKEVVMPAPKKEVKLSEAPKEKLPKNENVISDPNETLAYDA